MQDWEVPLEEIKTRNIENLKDSYLAKRLWRALLSPTQLDKENSYEAIEDWMKAGPITTDLKAFWGDMREWTIEIQNYTRSKNFIGLIL